MSQLKPQDPKALFTPPPPPTPLVPPVDEMTYINQQMSEQNEELSYRNKTLSILQKVDEIILSSVTDPVQVGQRVADAVVPETGYKAVSIFLFDQDGGTIFLLSISQTEEVREAEQRIGKQFIAYTINLSEKDNFIARAIRDKSPLVTNDLYDIFAPNISRDDAATIQSILGVRALIIYPLIVRGEARGAMLMARAEEVKYITPADRTLMDKIAGIVAIAMDSALLYERIQDANVKLKELDHLKDEFVSLASHELRTPLTSIRSYLWMVMQGKAGAVNEKQKYYLDRIYISAHRLLALVNDMLNVSRIESGRIALTKQDTDMVELVKDTFMEMMVQAQDTGVQLSLSDTGEIPHVMVDSDKIKEVLINLLGNSLKFTPKGGTITVSLEVASPFLMVHVTDTGRGISSENINSLFQKFGIISGTYSSSMTNQGTGLGLYITKSIIELHGGTITVSSPGEGKGTTFTFTLPLVSVTPVTT